MIRHYKINWVSLIISLLHFIGRIKSNKEANERNSTNENNHKADWISLARDFRNDILLTLGTKRKIRSAPSLYCCPNLHKWFRKISIALLRALEETETISWFYLIRCLIIEFWIENFKLEYNLSKWKRLANYLLILAFRYLDLLFHIVSHHMRSYYDMHYWLIHFTASNNNNLLLIAPLQIFNYLGDCSDKNKIPMQWSRIWSPH